MNYPDAYGDIWFLEKFKLCFGHKTKLITVKCIYNKVNPVHYPSRFPQLINLSMYNIKVASDTEFNLSYLDARAGVNVFSSLKQVCMFVENVDQYSLFVVIWIWNIILASDIEADLYYEVY